MDTTITSEPVDSGTAVTTAPDQTPGQGNAAPEQQVPDAGGEQSTAEGGQQETGAKRKWSVYDEIKELRAQRREWRQSQSEWQSERNQIMDELRQLRELQTRPAPGKAERDPSKFWQDPEASIDARLDDRLTRLEESLANRFDSVRQREQAEVALHQERQEAVEFIRTQKGYDPEDDEDLIEIIHKIPNKETLSPQFVAEYAWMKLQQTRGVGDRSNLKQRATSVIGQPPGAGLGKKQYSAAEFDQAVNMAEDMLRKNPSDPKINDLLSELHSAQRDGRVR